VTTTAFAVAICDLDGTLLDSDEALVAPFVALGVDAGDVRFGALPGEECARLGVDLRAYLGLYDVSRAQLFPGVDALVAGLGRWAVCSNKDRAIGRAELARLGWHPEAAWFAGDFDGPKRLQPLLDHLGVAAADAVYVGDTDHDRSCAADAGVAFSLAAWNPRARPDAADLVLHHPADLLTLLGRGQCSGTSPSAKAI
jgi:phosphoglycolate phosphatase-like HAD superfamily hydrolase